MKLTQKNLTRLLKEDVRKRLIKSVTPKKLEALNIIPYTADVFKKFCVDKTFPKIILLEATLKDGTIKQRLFETKHLEGLLKVGKNLAAIEVVRCWLILWSQFDKNVQRFGAVEKEKKDEN